MSADVENQLGRIYELRENIKRRGGLKQLFNEIYEDRSHYCDEFAKQFYMLKEYILQMERLTDLI